jgi:hypothetical protein
MAPEPSYLKNPSNEPMCVSVCTCNPQSLLGNSSIKTFPRLQTHTTDELSDVSFSMRYVASQRSLWIPLLLLGGISANTIPRQQPTVWGVVFYVLRAVWKERRRLILSRTNCLFLIFIALFVLSFFYRSYIKLHVSVVDIKNQNKGLWV